ncbi:MAG: UPF0182 family protein, partial [Clostridia bacterium]|nr:UPF0182 family protein [Clostridia bacterium]
MSRSRLFWTFSAVVVALFAMATKLSALYVDWLWFDSLGYAGVFWRRLAADWVLAAGVGALFAVVVWLNLWLLRADVELMPGQVVPPPYNRWLRRGRVGWTVTAVSGGLGLLAGLSAADQGTMALQFLYRVPFGTTDPVFGRDIGFYVFVLPILRLAYTTVTVALVLGGLMAAAGYVLTGRISYSGHWFYMHPRARVHLFGTLAAFFALLAVGYGLRAYGVLFSTHGASYGASYTDLHARLPALRVLAALSVVLAVLALLNLRARRHRPLIGGVILLAVASLGLGAAYPAVVQEFVVRPNEIARERPYIVRTIEFTRRAYGLDAVEEREYPVESRLTAEGLRAEPGTIQNVRLWDWRVLQSAYQQVQGIRSYYAFDEMDIDRYRVGGQYRQVLVSAREIRYRSLPERTWVNQHLKYTHGYGVVVSPAAQVDGQGLPVLWTRDIPPVANVPELEVRRPEIYFGEQTDTYAIVRTTEEEFDYPLGDTNAYTRYRGADGLPIGRPLPRLAFALLTGDYNVLFSRSITAESRLLFRRDIGERVQRIAPFLLYDPDPYIVVVDGRLVWLWDAYTVTDSYPYSEPHGLGFNYIRNAVKVAVDAYEGTVDFYVAAPDDPIVRTLARAYPGLFQPLDAMPAALRQHLRYPELLFTVQAEMFTKYHMQDPVVYYNREDLWARPQEIAGESLQPVRMDPYYVIMQLPGEPASEFLIMTPFTPVNRANMIAWMAGRSDGEHYGRLLVFKFPKDRTVFGPMQIESLINQDDVISERITLWNQQGSTVLRGNLLVIPVAGSLLYVEPLYLQSRTTQLPELRRVIVAAGSRVVMAETLEEALTGLLGPGVGTGPVGRGAPGAAAAPAGPPGAAPPATATPAPAGAPADAELRRLAAEARRTFREAEEALRAGDWARYGQRMEELRRVLERMSDGG